MGTRASAPALIGRESELAELTAALDRADAGTPTIAIVAGDAGIGKTRLVETLVALATERGGRVLAGGCLDLADDGLPYAPLIEGLRGLGRALGPAELQALLGPAAGDLRRMLPGLGPLTGLPVADPAGPAGSGAGSGDDPGSPSHLDQARLYELILGLFRGLSGDGPGVVVVEDLHWVDRATQDLIRFLVRNLSTERVLLVLTVRTDGLARGDAVAAWLAGLERDPGTVRLDLAPLDLGAVARLLEAVAEAPVEPALVERIHARSGGNPYFVEELFNWERSGARGPLPRTLTETLIAQVAALPDAAQAMLGIVAVGGRAVDERLVAAVAEVPEATVREPIRMAVERGVLVFDLDSGALRARHALLAEVIEASLLPAERRMFHERYATVLVARPELADPSPTGATGELAHHWFAADRPLEAFRASIEAAEAAERRLRLRLRAPAVRAGDRARAAHRSEARTTPTRSNSDAPPPRPPTTRATPIVRSAGCGTPCPGWTRPRIRSVPASSMVGWAIRSGSPSATRMRWRSISRPSGWSRPTRRRLSERGSSWATRAG